MHDETKAPVLSVTKQYFLRWKEKKRWDYKRTKFSSKPFFPPLLPFSWWLQVFKQQTWPLMRVCKQSSKDHPLTKKTHDFGDTNNLFLGTTRKKLTQSFPHRKPYRMHSVHQRSLLTFQEKTTSQTAFPGLFPLHFRGLQLCIGPALVTVMLLGSSKSLPLNANVRKSMPWLAKEIF